MFKRQETGLELLQILQARRGHWGVVTPDRFLNSFLQKRVGLGAGASAGCARLKPDKDVEPLSLKRVLAYEWYSTEWKRDIRLRIEIQPVKFTRKHPDHRERMIFDANRASEHVSNAPLALPEPIAGDGRNKTTTCVIASLEYAPLFRSDTKVFEEPSGNRVHCDQPQPIPRRERLQSE